MNKYIYILTDSNRDYLHVGMTGDLQQALTTYDKFSGMFVDGRPSHTSRLVYYEICSGADEALRRFNEVSRYTRMQKERLIRRYNPNWLNLTNNSIPIGVIRIDSRHTPNRQFA